MGTCKYCGLKTNLFFSSHKECEEKHVVGLAQLDAAIKKYFQGQISTIEISRIMMEQRKNAFIKKDDAIMLSVKAIDAYIESIKFPTTDSQLSIVTDYMATVKLTPIDLNQSGTLTNLAKKLIRGQIVSYFIKGSSLSSINQSVSIITRQLPIGKADIDDCYINVLNQAADKFLADGLLSDHEERQITNYASSLGIQLNNLPSCYSNTGVSKVYQSIILKNLQKGLLPVNNFVSPIVLSQGEAIIWEYKDVTMYREKVEKQYQGNRGGWSFRVMKGVHYHTGNSKLKPIEYSYMKDEGKGSLYITNKHIIYQGAFNAEKIPYKKIIGVTPYSDGIEVHKDGANQKRLTFQGFDSWFFMNVLSIVTQ